MLNWSFTWNLRLGTNSWTLLKYRYGDGAIDPCLAASPCPQDRSNMRYSNLNNTSLATLLFRKAVLGRKEDIRRALFANLFLYENDDDIPTPCHAMPMLWVSPRTSYIHLQSTCSYSLHTLFPNLHIRTYIISSLAEFLDLLDLLVLFRSIISPLHTYTLSIHLSASSELSS